MANLNDVEEEKEEEGPSGAVEKASEEDLDPKNPVQTEAGSGAEAASESISTSDSSDVALSRQQKTCGQESRVGGGKDEENFPAVEIKAGGKEISLEDSEIAKEEKNELGSKGESNDDKSRGDGLSKL